MWYCGLAATLLLLQISSLHAPPADSASGPVSVTIPTSAVIASTTSQAGGIQISLSSQTGDLCTLTLKKSNYAFASPEAFQGAPIARSYDGLAWEKTAGPLSATLPKPICTTSYCTFVGLPPPDSNEDTYLLTSYSHSGFGVEAEAARFLEQASFGPSRDTINGLLVATSGNKYERWVKNQIENVPLSSHREYFRRRIVPRQEYAGSVAAPGPESACERTSHWRMFALSERDGIRNSQSKVSMYLYIRQINGKYVWYVEGYPRTVTSYLPKFYDKEGEVLNNMEQFPVMYLLHYREAETKSCIGCPFLSIKLGGSSGNDTGYIQNPKVDLTGIENLVPYKIVNLPPILGTGPGEAMVSVDNDEFETSKYFSRFHRIDDEFWLKDASSVDSSECNDHPNVFTAAWKVPSKLNVSQNNFVEDKHHPETVFPPIFGKTLNKRTGKYEYLLFDPKMKLYENTVENPIPDGGGFVEYHTEGYTNCANAPRNIFNEHGCKLFLLPQPICAFHSSAPGKSLTSQFTVSLVPLNTGKLSFSEFACTEAVDLYDYTHGLKNPNKDPVIVCGTIGEVENDLTFGTANAFDIMHSGGVNVKKLNTAIYLAGEFQAYKNTVWANHAIFGDDQLRQRVAWALYQLIPIGKPDASGSIMTEMWLQYYDIFVRHAFGSYRDVLKEIAYTDVMGEWLDYYNNMSLQYNIDNCDLEKETMEQCENTHPDEVSNGTCTTTNTS